MKMIKIGIDLATRKTGIAYIGEQTITKTLKLKPFNIENMTENIVDIDIMVNDLNYMKRKNEAEVYIELSNYGNSTTAMFSFYAGIITKNFLTKNVYYILPTTWQKKMLKDMNINFVNKGSSKKIKESYYANYGGIPLINGKGKKMSIKDISILNARIKTARSLNEDEADAFNLAYYSVPSDSFWKDKNKFIDERDNDKTYKEMVGQ